MNSSHTHLCPRPLENHSVCPAPRVYEWAWAGQCAPGQTGGRRYETFSVGCFQWLPRSDGGLKKGKVVERFQGRTDAPDEVYARAAAWCAERNAAFVRLPPCPICGRDPILKEQRNGGHYIQCPPKGWVHAHVAALTAPALHQLWREFAERTKL